MHAPNDGMSLMSLSRAIPILFSAPMVLALLAGKKTQTRRLAINSKFADVPDGRGGVIRNLIEKPSPWRKVQPGTRLWVRESCWADWQGGDDWGVRYAADRAWIKATDEERWTALDCYAHRRHPDNATNTGQLVPSIHMPRWASRLTLTVTDVRVQRLQSDITEEDAEAEGAEPLLVPPDGGSYPYIEGFLALWDSIHGAGACRENPEVVALTFTVERRNIDASREETT